MRHQQRYQLFYWLTLPSKFFALGRFYRKLMEMSQLDDIAYVDTFKLQTVSGDNAPAIYSNGRHQVAIQIIVKAVKNDDKPMKDSDEMFKRLHLCFADDGSKLNWQGNNNWTYTDVEGEFNGESLGTGPISTIVSDDGTMIFKWFVSSTIVQIRRIAASIYTSTKYFTTADKPSGAEKSSVRIEARQPIDYNDHTNTEIKSGAFDTLRTNLFWESNLPAFNLYKKHYDGTSKRRIVYIHPTSKTGQTKFKKHEIVYTPLYNSDICTNGATLKWHNGIPLSCFDLINSSGLPCAVIGRCKDKKEFQISMWYSRQNSIGIGGSVFIESKHYYNLLEPEVNEDHFGVDEYGIPTLLLYQFSFTTDDKTTHYKWENKMNSPTVKLTDHYGNEGSFQLIFNDESNFDEPGRRSLNSNQQSD